MKKATNLWLRLMLVVALGLVIPLSACGPEEDPLEQDLEEMGDDLEDTGDELEEGLEDTGEEVGDAAQELEEDIENPG